MPRISSFAAQTLQRQIHEGRFRSGEMLPGQRELSVNLGISRAALREAISTLEALGLVRCQPGKGVFVTAGLRRPLADVPTGPLALPAQDVFQFRAIVEPAAAALVARRRNDAARAMLEASQHALEAALHSLDLVAAAEADLAFHLALAEHSANPLLASVIRSLEEPIGHSVRLPFAEPEGLWAPADEHRAVLDAIRAGDGDAAHTAMSLHLMRAAARVGIHFNAP